MSHPNAKPQASQGFTERVNRAHLSWQAKQGRKIGQAEIGKLVGKALKTDPINASTVSRWFQGSEPPLATIAALAKVFGCEPGWLAFGDGEPPEDPVVSRVRPLPRP